MNSKNSIQYCLVSLSVFLIYFFYTYSSSIYRYKIYENSKNSIQLFGVLTYGSGLVPSYNAPSSFLNIYLILDLVL